MLQKSVYLSLGSNLGDREENLRLALERLRELGELRAVSDLYETEPVDVHDQPWFLNCAALLVTSLMPMQLLARTQQIEHDLGRRPGRAKGPRVADIDILLFARSIVESPRLTIPHPALHERRFVLTPLADIAPDVRHPVLKRTMRELRDRLPLTGQTVKPAGKLSGFTLVPPAEKDSPEC